MPTFTTSFGLSDRVLIDGDESIVTASVLQLAWVSDRRLGAAPEHLAGRAVVSGDRR